MKISNISLIDNLVEKLKQIQYQHSNQAQRAVNLALVSRNWFFGYYIVEFENGSETNLKLCRNFYLNYPEIGQTLSDQSSELVLDRFKLTWSHYIVLLSIKNTEERNFYEIESMAGNWSLRELKRQFNSSLYERLILSQNKKSIELSKRGQVLENPQDLLKDPYVLEFLKDLGQMQMYVNYFDRFVKQDFENKTVGIIICKKKKESLVEITLPENSNIHASEYRLYLPSKDEFKKQIEEAQF
jgi:predicted nuclease of restriction endonuclease-like (RecB) superfamily